MIFKFQRPLFSSDGNSDVLAYDESREFETMLPMVPELLVLFGDAPKFFADCEVTQQDSGFRLTLKNKVQDPHW